MHRALGIQTFRQESIFYALRFVIFIILNYEPINNFLLYCKIEAIKFIKMLYQLKKKLKLY